MKLKQRALRRVWIWLPVFTAIFAFVPSRYTAFKVGFVGGTIAFVLLTLLLYVHKRCVRFGTCLFLAIAGCLLALLILPGRPYDSSKLRREYVKDLISYQGTHYIWGGGNRLGIDCSGLVQTALIDACFNNAFTTGNPALARAGISLWWHNRSARALGDGYRNETTLLREVPDLNTADYTRIEPGDLAVLSDGVHVLAYVGSRTWIEADPVSMRVILASAPRETDYYFGAPAKIVRWRALDEQGGQNR